VFGLGAVADALAAIARRDDRSAAAFRRLPSLHTQIARRGACCAHPDGALAFVATALDCFADEFQRHLAGRCSASDHATVLPATATDGGWR